MKQSVALHTQLGVVCSDPAGPGCNQWSFQSQVTFSGLQPICQSDPEHHRGIFLRHDCVCVVVWCGENPGGSRLCVKLGPARLPTELNWNPLLYTIVVQPWNSSQMSLSQLHGETGPAATIWLAVSFHWWWGSEHLNRLRGLMLMEKKILCKSK